MLGTDNKLGTDLRSIEDQLEIEGELRIMEDEEIELIRRTMMEEENES